MLENLTTFFTWLAIAMGIALVLATIGLALMWNQLRQLRVPAQAGFFATMHYVPLPFMMLLDLLDFGLDIFAAPISWLLLDRLGLRGLRNKAALEALIPFTQPIPTFTIAWIAARTLQLGDDPLTTTLENEVMEVRRRLDA